MLIDGPTKAPPLVTETRTPKKRWWQRFSKPTEEEILRNAVDVLDRRGWAKGGWVVPDGSVCLLGAIGVAAIEAGRSASSNEVEFIRVALSARRIIGGVDEVRLYRWNDRKAEGSTDVKRKLLTLAAVAEANGGRYPR